MHKLSLMGAYLKENSLLLALPLLLPLAWLSLPFFFLSFIGLVALTISKEIKGLLIGWTLLFAMLFLFFRHLPQPERIWVMGLTLSIGISSLIIYFLQGAPKRQPKKQNEELDDTWEKEAQLLELKRRLEELQHQPDKEEDQLVSELVNAEQVHQEAMVEIASLEGVVENLLEELKSRSVPVFPQK